jgi:hypothetical protein
MLFQSGVTFNKTVLIINFFFITWFTRATDGADYLLILVSYSMLDSSDLPIIDSNLAIVSYAYCFISIDLSR